MSLLSSNAVAGDTIRLYNASIALGSVYTLTSTDIINVYADVQTGALANGTSYAITAKVKDIAGNESGPSASFATTIDTTAPVAPSITSVTDNVGPITGALTTGGRSNDTDLTVRVSLLSSNAVAGDTIRLYNASTALGSAYTLTSTEITNGYADVQAGTLADGTSYAITAKVRDIAGNESGASASFNTTIDTTAPTLAVSGVKLSNDTGTSLTDLITNMIPQYVTATLSSALTSGDTLMGSFDNLIRQQPPQNSGRPLKWYKNTSTGHVRQPHPVSARDVPSPVHGALRHRREVRGRP